LINVTVYYFIWRAVYSPSGGAGPAATIAGFVLSQMLTYVARGWIIRSFYWKTICQGKGYQVRGGEISLELIKTVSVQGRWLGRAAGESAFRLGVLAAPTGLLIALLFPVRPPASTAHFALFLLGVVGSFLLMGAINFMIGTCAIPFKSILALIRAKYWLIELLSGLLVPMTFFPAALRKVAAWLPFEHIAFTPLEIYLGKLSPAATARALLLEWAWVAVLGWLGNRWWLRATRKITIHGG